jgi:hypothetical protein
VIGFGTSVAAMLMGFLSASRAKEATGQVPA